MPVLPRYSLTSSFPIRDQSPLLPASSIAQQSCRSPGQEGVDVVRRCWVWAQRWRDHKCRSLGPVLAPVVRPIGPETGRDRLTKHHIAWKGGQKGLCFGGAWKHSLFHQPAVPRAHPDPCWAVLHCLLGPQVLWQAGGTSRPTALPAITVGPSRSRAQTLLAEQAW